eukprot:scaffold54021_cov29-Prasinocladus_malaysianus.AAC.1
MAHHKAQAAGAEEERAVWAGRCTHVDASSGPAGLINVQSKGIPLSSQVLKTIKIHPKEGRKSNSCPLQRNVP